MSQKHQNDVGFIQDGDINVEYLKVKMDLLKRWNPKVCKKINPTCVCGYNRQFCPSGHCLAEPRDAKQ